MKSIIEIQEATVVEDVVAITIIMAMVIIITEVTEEEGAVVDILMQDLSLEPMEEGLRYMPHIISLLKYGMQSHMLKEGGLMKKDISIAKIKG